MSATATTDALSTSPTSSIPSKRSHNEVEPATPPASESPQLESVDATEPIVQEKRPEKPVTFKVQFGKDVHEMTMDLSDRVSELKSRVEALTGVHTNLQKLLYKGNLKDEQTLAEAKLTSSAKVILMASKVEDVLKVSAPLPVASSSSSSSPSPSSASNTWSEQLEHKKIIEKGKPDDAEEGFKGSKFGIPARGVTGLLNRIGQKTRLTFKAETEELWIGTAERTQKVPPFVPYNTIRAVTSQAIKGHEGYHIVGLQMGPTDKVRTYPRTVISNYWLYWVPAQYVEAIKDKILGQWQPFV
ncbi:Ubiquitin domain-containing protein ubfd1 [Gonapodya sp. JEL0774]|nr:Ubiquitin domain-containing protein ubfd1 [Gonapodya sp. JEL0774]